MVKRGTEARAVWDEEHDCRMIAIAFLWHPLAEIEAEKATAHHTLEHDSRSLIAT